MSERFVSADAGKCESAETRFITARELIKESARAASLRGLNDIPRKIKKKTTADR